jgi:DNA-binding MarR family transcriptional regulator
MENNNREKTNRKRAVCDEVLIAIRRIIQSIDLHSRDLVRQFGLTGPQLIVLQEISRLGEGSVGEIAKAISLGQATVTGILERLENRGLIIKHRSQNDKRRVLVQSTSASKQLLEKAPPPMQEHFIQQLTNLQDWEQAMILSSLQRIVAMMDAKNIEAAPILTAGPIDEIKENLTLEE